MRPLTAADILPIEEFTAARVKHEQQVLEHKASRRVHLGENMTFLFENHVTLLWQIHEMCRVEGLIKPEAIAHELQTYNALLPGKNELSATLLVEFPDPDERDRMAHALLGLHNHLHLKIDGLPQITAKFDGDQFNEKRISTVQFVRFELPETHRDALLDLGRTVKLVSDHPAYLQASPLSGASRGALAEDLSS